MSICARKEAAPVMRSSATTAFRAFLMLVCTVAIPVWAIWGASWSEICKKFQNLHCPAILNLASASPATPAATSDAPAAVKGDGSSFAGTKAGTVSAPLAAPALPASSPGTAGAAAIPSGCRDIQDRLQRMGATYYVLESWGNNQQLYRFCCKMAVGGNADYVHCFEATHADPLQAMQQVLRQVENWRGGLQYGG
jgi:hypothetical protein